MMAYWADNNQKALDDLANLERFMAMSWSLKGTDDCYYYGQKDANGLPMVRELQFTEIINIIMENGKMD